MKQALFDQISAQLTLDRASLERVYLQFPLVDKQTLLAIYLRKAQNSYKVAHANLSALPHAPTHFYQQFRAEAQRRAVDGPVQTIIAEMGEQVGLPPCLMARFVIKSFLHQNPDFLMQNNSVVTAANESFSNELADTSLLADSEAAPSNPSNPSEAQLMKTAAARVSKILRNPQLVLRVDEFLAHSLQFCLENDFLTSPSMDIYRHQIGQEKEEAMLESLKQLGILFQPESEMRAAGYPKTPDALLAYPVEIDGHIVNWIESKALFGDATAHSMYSRDQYWPYYNRFGPGLVIYWFGFVDELNTDKERGILISDHLPQKINKIQLE